MYFVQAMHQGWLLEQARRHATGHIPARQFSGMIDPVSSLECGARFVGKIFSATHLVTIYRGTFSKALSFADLGSSLLPIALAISVIVVLSVLLLKKQER